MGKNNAQESAPKSVAKNADAPIESFVRIRKHPLKKGDHFEAFQPEVIYVQGDRVVDRKLLHKPDVFEMAFSQAAEMVDPRNDEKPTPPPF